MSAPDYSIGSPNWNGLSKLIEEAGEVIQVAGKILGAGGACVHWDGSDLAERLADEIGDLRAAIKFFEVMNQGYDTRRADRRCETKRAQFVAWHSGEVDQ